MSTYYRRAEALRARVDAATAHVRPVSNDPYRPQGDLRPFHAQPLPTHPWHWLAAAPQADARTFHTWAMIMKRGEVGLVVELPGTTDSPHVPPLKQRRQLCRVNAEVRGSGKTTPPLWARLWDSPGQLDRAITSHLTLSSMKVSFQPPSRTASAPGDAETQAFDLLAIGTLARGVLSPEDTLAAAQVMVRFHDEHPTQAQMTMCPSGCDASAQMAVACLLFEQSRLGRLTAANLDSQIEAACRQVTEVKGVLAPNKLPALASLLAFGEALLLQPASVPTDLPRPSRHQTPAPALQPPPKPRRAAPPVARRPVLAPKRYPAPLPPGAELRRGPPDESLSESPSEASLQAYSSASGSVASSS